MKVKIVSKFDLDLACEFVYENIRTKENKLPFFPDSFIDIRKHLLKILNSKNDNVLICYEKNDIVGCIAYITEVKRKQITIVGGPFLGSKKETILYKFIQYFKSNYPEFSLIFATFKENYLINNCLESFKARMFSDVFVYKYNNSIIHKSENNLSKIDDENYLFFDVLFEHSRLIYNAEKLVASNLFNVFLYKENDGYVIIRGKHFEEVYLKNSCTLEDYCNVLKESMNKVGFGTYYFSVEVKNKKICEALNTIGFECLYEVVYYRLDFYI